MKKVFSFGVLLFSVLWTYAYQITFRVDMTNQTVSPNGVSIAGNFQDPDFNGSPDNPSYLNWTPAAIQVIDGEETINNRMIVR